MDAHNVERRMAAILAADAVGYSRLMSADEEATLRTLRSHRELFDAAIARHGGRIFSTAGDSVVAEFASPVQAVRCAVEAQRALAERNAALPETRRMHFRIGLHLGDVMVNGADLLGDGVNVAARLEALAPPGGVILSRAMVEQVRAALPLDYRYLGDKTLARAYGKVANTYTVEVNLGWSDAAEAIQNSIRYGEQAVALDAALPEAHWTLAYAYAWAQQLPQALTHIETAIALNPNYADALAYYGLLLCYDGRSDEGRASVARAMRANPQYPHWYDSAMGNNLYMAGRYEEAVAQLKRGLARKPNWAGSRRTLVAAYGQLGLIDDAQWELAELEAAGIELTLSNTRATSPYRDEASVNRMIEGLRKAGVKE